jgi:hypothetical protein
MTKKVFLGLSLLVIAGLWTACSNDEALNNENKTPISFHVQGGAPSLRATGTTLDFVNVFVVNAYGDVTGAASPAVATMNGVTVYRVEHNTEDIFDYNPKLYYHSTDGTVYFSAYSPLSKSISQGLKDNDANTIDYEVIKPDKDNGNTTQEDLLVAYTAQTDLSGTKVPLTFKHALSRVYVKATNKTPETVIIKGLKLGNLYENGSLKIDGTAWQSGTTVDINLPYKTTISAVTDYKVLWTTSAVQNGSYEYVLPLSGVAVPTSTGGERVFIVSKEQGMMVLPQTTVSSTPVDYTTDFYLEVTYKLSNIEETVKIPFSDLNNITGEGLTFEFGRQYALNIDFENKSISFTVTVEDWDAEIDVPVI